MDPDRWNQIKDIFDAAYEQPHGERAEFVKRACGDDTELLAEVQSLMVAEDSAHSLLDGVALDAVGVVDDVSWVGRTVGPYVLKDQLGVGGMGEVYLAERADGQFEHQVALKLVRAHVHSSQILARFRSERQILARLQHPNIARLLDGGLTDDGHPYFVIEYVDGLPIDVYANKQELGVDARLALFDQVCRAVTYAHSNLVVHRDLKPSNILVTKDGRVKLLDFGIAKVLSDQDEDDGSAPLTRTGAAVMTPAYASPEQVRGEPVGTSTDIYSLGVVLYELLTGLRPYDVSGKNALEAARVICEHEPYRPSTAVSESTRESTTTYGSDTGRLRRLLSGDLDVICLKALRKEPERRYTTSDELGDDIRRHLSGRPIEARSESVAYRAGKFVRRHRAGVALLVFALALTGFYTVRLGQERDRARLEAEKARQVSEFLQSVFAVSDPSLNKGETLTAREVLDEGRRRLESELAGQPEILSDMLFVIADVYDGLGLYEPSLSMHEEVLALRKELYAPPHIKIAESLNHAGEANRKLGNFATADSLYAESLAMQIEVDAPEGGIAVLYNNLGISARDQGRHPESDSLLQSALKIYRSADEPDLDEITTTLGNLAITKAEMGKTAQADSLLALSLEIMDDLYAGVHPKIAGQLVIQASMQRRLGNQEKAAELYRTSVQMSRHLYPPGHTAIGGALSNFGSFLRRVGEYEESEAVLREAYEIQFAALGPEHANTVAVMNNLSRLYADTGRYREADSLRYLILERNRAWFGDEHRRVAMDYGYLGTSLFRQGRYAEAREARRKQLAINQKTLAEDDIRIAYAYYTIAECDVELGDDDEARRLIDQSLEIILKKEGNDHEAVEDLRALRARLDG